MIGKITGEVLDSGKDTIIINTSCGVGYLVNVSNTDKKELLTKKRGDLFIYTSFSNNSISLFGFLNNVTYTTFLLLISVSGIGPKKAQGILESIPAKTLLSSIRQDDVETIESFGINKTQAKRLVLELQKKIKTDPSEAFSNDLIAGLIALGYSRSEINEALKLMKNNKKDSTEKMLQEALKIMHSLKK